MVADCPSCRRLRHLERSLRRRRVPEPSPAAIERADSEQPVALDLTPLAERLGRPAIAFGADVAGFDLRELADSGHGRRELYEALVEHGALIFRPSSAPCISATCARYKL